MTDVELEVADSFERVFPVPTVVADWDDVLDRAGARSGTPTRPPSRWRVVAIAAAIVAGAALLATPALGIGDRLLSLIQGKPSPTRRAGSCLVARRTDDRVRELARRQRRGLRHGRRRQRASEPHAAPGEGCPPCLVARRTEDRLREPAGRQLRGLRHERRREREAEPHAGSGERRLSNLVTRRAEDRVLARHAQLRPRRDRVHGYHLYVVNADGSGLRRLHSVYQRGLLNDRTYRGGQLVWSPDGRTIYFGRYLVRTDGSGARRLPYIPLTAVWSPDGRRIAFARKPDWCAGRGLVRAAFVALGYLRHERRRERNPQADAQRTPKRRTCLVPGRAKDRFPEHTKRQQGYLRHERRRKRKAEPHTKPGAGQPSLLVTGRAEDRVRQRPRRASRGSRHERRRERSAESDGPGQLKVAMRP